MNKLTKNDYVVIAKAFKKAGYTAETVYEALESAGYSVEIEGCVYDGVYASRVMAIMHNSNKTTLKL